MPDLAAGVGPRHLHEPRRAVQADRDMTALREGLQVAPRSAAQVEQRERRGAMQMAQQRVDVLADVVVAGAVAERLGAGVVVRQRRRPRPRPGAGRDSIPGAADRLRDRGDAGAFAFGPGRRKVEVARVAAGGAALGQHAATAARRAGATGRRGRSRRARRRPRRRRAGPRVRSACVPGVSAARDRRRARASARPASRGARRRTVGGAPAGGIHEDLSIRWDGGRRDGRERCLRLDSKPGARRRHAFGGQLSQAAAGAPVPQRSTSSGVPRCARRAAAPRR